MGDFPVVLSSYFPIAAVIKTLIKIKNNIDLASRAIYTDPGF
jgi:hypothetical protein